MEKAQEKSKRGRRKKGPYLHTGEVLRLAGAPGKYMLIQRLREAGLIRAENLGEPCGRKGNRADALWTLGAVVMLRVYREAIGRGIIGPRLHAMLRALDQKCGTGKGLAMLATGEAIIMANPDGSKARVLYRQDAQLADLLKGQIILPLETLKPFIAEVKDFRPGEENRAARIHRAMEAKAAAG